MKSFQLSLKNQLHKNRRDWDPYKFVQKDFDLAESKPHMNQVLKMVQRSKGLSNTTVYSAKTKLAVYT